ncbi:MAG: TIGR01212 family radical SAM protein [Spirochaetales bacterium]|nr:TIGR01212 family radical SAM protein [Spirochaetales bacterium]
MEDELFTSYGTYLKQKYGAPAFRVGLDAGFSCPNRLSGRNSPGCCYCDAFGARAMYQRTKGADSDQVDEDLKADIQEQTDKAVRFLKKRYGAEYFLLYFQAFSSTYGTLQHLRNVYDYALSLQNYRELIISTRPDCIDEQKADLLLEYKERGYDVWVELGLQSAHDKTLERINRGHSVSDFEDAYNLLRKRGIKIAVHLIFGLPGEGSSEIVETCKYVAKLKPEGLKIHNLHIPYNSPLYKDFSAGKVSVPTVEEHLDYVITAIEHMPESTIIMRLTCDSQEDERAAPKNFLKKTEFYNLVRNEMKKRNSFQGRLFL